MTPDIQDIPPNLEAVWRVAMQCVEEQLIPPADMLPSVWAEKNVRIPIGNAIPGPISFANAPYQRGMLDAIKEPGLRRVDYMTGAQLGKTTVQQCITGYFIAHEPRSQILVQPTQGDIQTFLETKLRPMLDANPKISGKMAKQRGRDGVNNGRIISYIGGWLMFSWAGSPKTLRGRSAPVTQADEVDGMDATPEGDPVELLTQRAATFGDQQLDSRSSTPTIKGASRIETGFLAGDRRRYYVACPHCGHAQFLHWGQVAWTGRRSTGVADFQEDLAAMDAHDPETARYRCADDECGALWSDGERIAAIRQAEAKGHGWKAERPFKGHASFHAPEMLSTFRRLRDIVRSYLSKIEASDMQSFVNVSLGETFEETGEKADPDGLMSRREEYAAEAPMGVLFITAGIDMQQDRLEAEIVGWGAGEESWSLGYRVLWGDPLLPDVWEDLDDLLAETYMHETGVAMPIGAACLDTGGTAKQGASYTQRAYEYLKGKTGRRLFGTKGVGGWGRPIVEKGLKKQSGKHSRKVDLFLVGADESKLVVMRRLAQTVVGPGYCHFPADRDLDYFKGLTAEKLVQRYVKGFPVREWQKADRARNEPLDCRSLALAALKIIQPSFKRIGERMGVKPGKSSGEVISKPAQAAASPAQPAAKPAEIPQVETKPKVTETAKAKRPSRPSMRKRGGWATNW